MWMVAEHAKCNGPLTLVVHLIARVLYAVCCPRYDAVRGMLCAVRCVLYAVRSMMLYTVHCTLDAVRCTLTLCACKVSLCVAR